MLENGSPDDVDFEIASEIGAAVESCSVDDAREALVLVEVAALDEYQRARQYQSAGDDFVKPRGAKFPGSARRVVLHVLAGALRKLAADPAAFAAITIPPTKHGIKRRLRRHELLGIAVAVELALDAELARSKAS